MSVGLRRYAAWRTRSGQAAPFPASGRHLLTDLLGFLIFLGALFGIVGGVLHQPISGLLATSGLFAAIIGFAIQKMIADVFSGLALTVEGPFSLGDWLDVGGTVGRVTQANWRAVHLEAARLISNRDAARLSPEEHAEIGEVGIAAFLRTRILRFFGQPMR